MDEEKQTELNRSVGCHQAHQQILHRNFRRIGEKRGRKTFKRILNISRNNGQKNFQFNKDLNLYTQRSSTKAVMEQLFIL